MCVIHCKIPIQWCYGAGFRWGQTVATLKRGQEAVSRTPKWALLRSPPLLVSCKEGIMQKDRRIYSNLLADKNEKIMFL